MADKYYVYRPLLDLIGLSEGTDKGRGYNETLGYGAYTNGNVSLVTMTLDEIDALQTRMLKHPKNKLESSALGRYQIVRTTRRVIQGTLNLAASALFNEAMQDRMGCYLLGVRGIDKYLAGRLSEDTMINNLSREWASLPTTAGKGFYDGQRAAVTVEQVRSALKRVQERHDSWKPVLTPEPKPVTPAAKKSFWQWLFGRG